MDTLQLIRKVVEKSGIGYANASKALGKSDPYLNSTLSRGSIPRADTLSAICAVCGFTLCAIPSDSVPDTALVIDAPCVDTDAQRRALERKRDVLARELCAIDDRLDAIS